MTRPTRPRTRTAIVGAGGIAESSHVPALRAHADRTELVAVVDVDSERADAAAQRWGADPVLASSGVTAHTDLAAMLDAERPGLVLVCTPPSTHRDAVVAALDAGAWAWCEKPATLSLDELDDVTAHERPGGPHASFVAQHRFGSGGRRLQRLVADGELGRPLVAVCHTLWFRPPAYFEVPWRGRWATEGGGPTMGHGIHQIDLLLAVLGDWRSVTAVAGRLDRDVETEDVSMAVVTMESGAMVSVVNSLLSPREESHLRFDLTDATVELTHLYGYDDASWRWTPAAHVAADPDGAARAAAWAPVDGVPSSHAAQLGELLDALDAGRRPAVSGDDARRTLELVAAIYASAATGRAVRRGEVDGGPFAASMDGGGRVGAALAAGPGAGPESRARVRGGGAVSGRLRLQEREDRLVVVLDGARDGAGGVELLHLVHRDPCTPWEGPKPHLHPVRTTSGALVTGYRPHDHRWHKGFQVTLTHVDPADGVPQNFWGGNTFVAGRGYERLDAVGSTRHLGFERAAAGEDGERVDVVERLEWLTSGGERWFTETRGLAVHSADPGSPERPGTWAFDLTSDLVNASGQELRVGSPTTHGRPAAGYCGFFWRGPRAWTGGPVLSAAGEVADADAMGTSAAAGASPWLAVSGEHDDVDGGATVVVVADLDGTSAPAHWFVRSTPFPALAPSPAFSQEVVLAPGDRLRLAHRVLVADAQLTPEQITAALSALPPGRAVGQR